MIDPGLALTCDLADASTLIGRRVVAHVQGPWDDRPLVGVATEVGVENGSVVVEVTGDCGRVETVWPCDVKTAGA